MIHLNNTNNNNFQYQRRYLPLDIARRPNQTTMLRRMSVCSRRHNGVSAFILLHGALGTRDNEVGQCLWLLISLCSTLPCHHSSSSTLATINLKAIILISSLLSPNSQIPLDQ